MRLFSSSEDEDANLTQVSSTLQNLAHHTLLLALSEIYSPFVTAILFLLQILAFLWAIAHSFCFVKISLFLVLFVVGKNLRFLQ